MELPYPGSAGLNPTNPSSLFFFLKKGISKQGTKGDAACTVQPTRERFFSETVSLLLCYAAKKHVARKCSQPLASIDKNKETGGQDLSFDVSILAKTAPPSHYTHFEPFSMYLAAISCPATCGSLQQHNRRLEASSSRSLVYTLSPPHVYGLSSRSTHSSAKNVSQTSDKNAVTRGEEELRD